MSLMKKLLGIFTATHVQHKEIFGEVKPKEISVKPDKMEQVGGKDTRKRPSDDGWIHYTFLPFPDTRYSWFSIDTRDFHGTGHLRGPINGYPWPRKVDKRPSDYIVDTIELGAMLNRFYRESGGEGDWRMFTLKDVFRTLNWEMKYIRLYRVSAIADNLWLVCNTDDFVFNRRDLAQPVNQQFLNHSKYGDE